MAELLLRSSRPPHSHAAVFLEASCLSIYSPLLAETSPFSTVSYVIVCPPWERLPRLSRVAVWPSIVGCGSSFLPSSVKLPSTKSKLAPSASVNLTFVAYDSTVSLTVHVTLATPPASWEKDPAFVPVTLPSLVGITIDPAPGNSTDVPLPEPVPVFASLNEKFAAT